MRALVIIASLVLGACSAGPALAPARPDPLHSGTERSRSSEFHVESDIQRFMSFGAPTANRDARTAWRDFNRAWPERAFAVSATGQFGSGVNFPAGQTELAKARALDQCRSRAASPSDAATCELYAVNNDVVFPGREFQLPAPQFRLGPFSYRGEGFLRGPRVARGVIVWSHGFYGRCVDQRQFAIHPWVADLNNEGWDILRYDRDPCEDGDYLSVTRTLANSLASLKSAGYRAIVLAGQSRGAWQSLDAATSAPLGTVKAVVAVAPARFGSAFDATNQHSRMLDEWRSLLVGLRTANVPFLAFLFEGDEFDAAPQRRAQLYNWMIANTPSMHPDDSPSAVWVLPNQFGARTAHGSGSTPAFRDTMQQCISEFVTHGRRCTPPGAGDGGI